MAKKSNQEEIIQILAERVRKTAKKTVDQMAKQLQKEMIKNGAKKDEHTPNWLKSHGHPYGGLPRTDGKARGRKPHNTPIVHKVSGDLKNNIKIFETTRKNELAVGVNESDVPYIGYIINGTPGGQMIARDFMAYSLLKLKKRFRKKIAKNMKKAIKTKSKIRDIASTIKKK